jgi:hypothetical protein
MTDHHSAFRRTKASFEAVLVDADFAALVILKRKNNRGTTYFFGSAIANEEGLITSYFLVMASRETTHGYFIGRFDLHYVYVYAPSAVYYQADADTIFHSEIDLRPFSGEISEDSIPSKGFFARDHNRTYEFVKQPPSVRRITIDGQWSMAEFKEFYARYSDLYVFQEAINSVADKPLEKISEGYLSAFSSKPFRGGSSYLSFFKGLKSALRYHERPHLAAVQWASPGEIIIKGTDALFDSVERQIKNFEESYDDATESYKRLQKYMQELGWLEINSEEYQKPSSDQLKALSDMIGELARHIHVPCGKSFSQILQGDQIIEAKIFLAVFRRLEAVLGFVREGRVNMKTK